MIPRARVVHATPGRVRLKIGSKRGDAAYFQALLHALAEVEGVDRLQANPQTASVLLEFSSGGLRRVSDEALHRELFVLEVEEGSAHLPDAGAMQPWDHPLRMGLDWRLLAAMGLVGLAIRQMAEGKVLSPALTLLWYAYELLERSRRGRT